MAEPKIIPYTEEELYIVPKKKAAATQAAPAAPAAPAKVVPMATAGAVQGITPAVNPFTPAVKKSFLEENKTLLIVGGLVLLGVALTYFYYQRQQKKEEELRKKGPSPINRYRPGLSGNN